MHSTAAKVKHKNEFTNWKLSILSLLWLFTLFLFIFLPRFTAINRLVCIFCLFAMFSLFVAVECKKQFFYVQFLTERIAKLSCICAAMTNSKCRRERICLLLHALHVLDISIRGRLTDSRWCVWVRGSLFCVYYYEQFPYKKYSNTFLSLQICVFALLSLSLFPLSRFFLVSLV